MAIQTDVGVGRRTPVCLPMESSQILVVHVPSSEASCKAAMGAHVHQIFWKKLLSSYIECPSKVHAYFSQPCPVAEGREERSKKVVCEVLEYVQST